VCNDCGNCVDYDDYLAAFSQTRIPVKWPDAIPNLQPRDDIWPTDKAPVIRRLETAPTSSPSYDGVSTGAAKAATGHQFSLGRPALPGRSMSDTGVILLRVHRYQVAEDEVEVHEGR
jgi:hypothetical protein